MPWPCCGVGRSSQLLLLSSSLIDAHGPGPAEYVHFERSQTRNLAGADGRALQSATAWEPIRVVIDSSELRQQVTASQLSYLQDDVLQAAVRWFALAVRVKPVAGALKYKQHCSLVSTSGGQCVRVSSDFQRCGTATIPREHFADQEFCTRGAMGGCQTSQGGAGIENADLGIYVTAVDSTSCQGGTVAFASACRQGEDDRPVAGVLNFCPGHVVKMLALRRWHQDVAVAVHELFHIMGFSSTLFAFFRDDSGHPLTSRDSAGMPPYYNGRYHASSRTVVEETLADGSYREYLVLPKVLQAARDHFGCPTLDRLPLEEHGGEGSAYSHWDSRFMHTEIMTAESAVIPRVSDITLALLQDSGWYRVIGGADISALGRLRDSAAGLFLFGRNKGCSFLMERCISEGMSAFNDTFCTDSQGQCNSPSPAKVGCSHDLLSQGACTNCVHEQSLPERFQLFDDPRLGGQRTFMGHCPIVEPFWAYGYPTFCKYGSAWGESTSARYGESHGAASRCVKSTVTRAGFFPLTDALGTCHDVRCDASNIRVRIGEGYSTMWVECSVSESGIEKSVSGAWNGVITCPDHATICGPRGDEGPTDELQCEFPGVTRNGRCVCPPGSLGHDCRMIDIRLNRGSSPFGLHYIQQELILQVGVSLATVGAIKPTVIDGPPDLVYSVKPELPRGLGIRSQDGQVSGRPLAPASRAAYVVSAVAATGHATTASLFVTVHCINIDCAPDTSSTVSPSRNTTAAPSELSNPTTTYLRALETSSESHLSTSRPSTSMDTTSKPEVVIVMRLVLPSLRYRDVREDPGVRNFGSQLMSLFSSAVQIQLTLLALAESLDGFVVADVGLSGDAGLSLTSALLEERLIALLVDTSSVLRASNFARQYLENMQVSKFNGSEMQLLWPSSVRPDDTSDAVAERSFNIWDIGEWPGYFSSQPLMIKIAILSLAAVVVCLCTLCCCPWLCGARRCCSRKRDWRKRQSRRQGSSPREPGLAFAVGGSRGFPAEERYRAGIRPGAPQSPSWGDPVVSATVMGAQTSSSRRGQQQPDCNQAMEQMLEMGINFDAAKRALESSNWDVSRASAAVFDDLQVESATDGEAGHQEEWPPVVHGIAVDEEWPPIMGSDRAANLAR
eukprot:TRINITY_DN11467_c0_g1_i1.p1 TRINITY_DN11467_c0_g1~~TRINITY_DN11467_c0_g1_i1.p1  ORF type:complete len:1128 (-),score=147.38 TRINITY_DN11467_c0_g1_i1:57-3440(-)